MAALRKSVSLQVSEMGSTLTPGALAFEIRSASMISLMSHEHKRKADKYRYAHLSLHHQKCEGDALSSWLGSKPFISARRVRSERPHKQTTASDGVTQTKETVAGARYASYAPTKPEGPRRRLGQLKKRPAGSE